jgi:hypothetical protein
VRGRKPADWIASRWPDEAGRAGAVSCCRSDGVAGFFACGAAVETERLSLVPLTFASRWRSRASNGALPRRCAQSAFLAATARRV